jgi:hypothetical protein
MSPTAEAFLLHFLLNSPTMTFNGEHLGALWVQIMPFDSDNVATGRKHSL